MKWYKVVAGFVCAACCLMAPARARGQAAMADEINLLSKSRLEKERAVTHMHLATPGKGESPFPSSPGANVARMGEPTLLHPVPGILASAGAEAGKGVPPPRIAPPAVLLPSPRQVPFAAALDIPDTADEGPPDGLTLDAAIDRLVVQNTELLTKFQEIPKADADVLSAGLRNNPILSASAGGIAYGGDSPQRVGEASYNVSFIQGIDINCKRLDRIRAAAQAKRVLEAQYQDAVRLEIENLYAAYVDALNAREKVRFARAGLAGLDQLVELTKKLAAKGVQPKTDIDRAVIQQANAAMAVQAAEAQLRDAKLNLALLLAIPAEQAYSLELRGRLRESETPIGGTEELVALALSARPDLAAYRLGVQRAQAEASLAKKERISDVFVLYNPYTVFVAGGQSTSSWGLGAMVSLPVYNRNQGNIRRAQINVTQTQIELGGLERKVAGEVQKTVQDLDLTQAAVKQFEDLVIPSGRKVKEATFELFSRGQENLTAYLGAQREYNDVLSQYLDILVRHRRNVLRLNTTVGQRITP